MATDAVILLLSHDFSQPELVVDAPLHSVDDASNIHQSEASSIPTNGERPTPAAAAAASVVSGFDKIPEELTNNILSRLTAIELVRCKAVCKYWDSLISSPEFVYEHLNRTKSDPSSHHLLVSNGLVIFDLTIDIPGPFNSVACFSSLEMVVVGSVNGLICMAGQSLRLYRTADDIWILNPATGLSRQLPLPSKSRLTGKTKAVLFAFWFDGGVYKLAKLVSVDDGPAVLEVWASNLPDTWTEVDTLNFRFHPTSLRFLRDCDVLIEGLCAYWIVADHDEDIFVLSLDLKTLALKLIPLSDEQKYLPEGRSDILASVQNHVLFGANVYGNFVVLQNSFSDDGTFYVWTMSMDGSGPVAWSISYRIRLNFPFEGCLAWCTNGKLVLKSPRNVLTLLDLNTGKVAFLGEDLELQDISVNYGHDFVGSLVSIEGFKRNDLYDIGVGFSWPRDYPCGWGRACKKKMM